MQMIWQTRGASGEEGAAAHEWARWLELRHLVLVGFMADAGVEIFQLVRTWEPESGELSEYMEAARGLPRTVMTFF